MRRRAFAETLIDLADAAAAAMSKRSPVRVHQIEMILPLEVRLGRSGGEANFLAELPLCRWQTDFDLKPGTLRIVWKAGDMS
jgi:hypothetical protein